MDIKKIVVTLTVGFLGGFLAFLVADRLIANNPSSATSQYQVVGPGMVHKASLSAGLPDGGGGQGNVDLRDAAQKAVPGVVHVKTIKMGREYVGDPILEYWFGGQPQGREAPQHLGYGSGVIVSPDGYIITNNHVLEGSDKIMVVLNDKREFEAQIVGRDPNTDVALLKIDGKDLSYIEYGNSDDVSLGEWVLAVGNPYNLTSTVTAGIISAKARGLGGKMNLESFLQTDAAVNPGNSGGALVNAKGELIGINTAIQSPTGSYSGYSFAIPVNIVHKVVGDLKEYGKVQRAIIGISMGELTPALAEGLGLKESSGIYVAEVIAGGAADKAGMEKGDVIKQINGIEIKTTPELQGQLVKYNPGNAVKILVNRDGDEKVLDVVLQNTYGDTVLSGKNDFGVLGVKAEALTKAERYHYRLSKGVRIKEIKNGKFKSAGLSEGDIIVQINNVPINSAEDLAKAINNVSDDGVFVTAVSSKGKVEYFAFSLLD